MKTNTMYGLIEPRPTHAVKFIAPNRKPVTVGIFSNEARHNMHVFYGKRTVTVRLNSFKEFTRPDEVLLKNTLAQKWLEKGCPLNM